MYRKLMQASALAAMMGFTGMAGAQDNGKSSDGEAVARVNGNPITRAEAEAMVQQRGQGKQSWDALGDRQRRQVVNRLVEVSLLANEAEATGLSERPDIQGQIEMTRNLTLARAVIQQMRQDQGAISEKQVRQAYQDQYGDQSGSQEMRARHILVEEKAKANELIGQLDDGADFAELARKHSTGPTKDKGGDLGWFAPDDMVTAFSEAAAELEVGNYTAEPVKTQYGFHVIKLEDQRSADKPAFEDKRQELRRKLASDRIADKIDELRKNADVKLNVAGGKKQGAESSEAGGDKQ